MWMEPLNIGKVFKVAFNWSTKYSFNIQWCKTC